jgi:hypothetical protein
MTDALKWRLLGGLTLLWLALIAIRVVTQPEPQRVPLAYRSGQVVSRDAATKAGGFPTVAKARAKTQEIPFREPKNIFASLDTVLSETQSKPIGRVAKKGRREAVPGTSGDAPASVPVVQAPPPPSPEELAAQQARLLREQEEQRVRQQLAQYRFLGYLSQGGESKAFLGRGRDLFIVRTGEIVEGRIQVKGIDATSVKLLDASTSLEATLPLLKTGEGAS